MPSPKKPVEEEKKIEEAKIPNQQNSQKSIEYAVPNKALFKDNFWT